MSIWMLLVSCMVLGVCVLYTHAGVLLSDDTATCVKRRLNYRRKEFFIFKINRAQGSEVDRALRSSNSFYKSRKGEDLRILIKWRPMDPYTGFRGKVCFKARGAQSIAARYETIARRTSCVEANAFGGKLCQHTYGRLFHDPVVPVQPGGFHEHCVEAPGNSYYIFNIKSAGGRINVKSFYFKGCHHRNRRTY